jgi:hypothetical protein
MKPMASLPNAKTVTYEGWLTMPEGAETGFLCRVRVPSTGILQPKPVPHVHIDITQIWPD